MSPQAGSAGLEVLRREQKHRAGWNVSPHRTRGTAGIVDSRDRRFEILAARIREAQRADMIVLTGRIENRHLVNTRLHWGNIVHGHQESVRGANVREHLQIRDGLDFEPPVAGAGPGAAFEVFLDQVRDGVVVDRVALTTKTRCFQWDCSTTCEQV